MSDIMKCLSEQIAAVTELFAERKVPMWRIYPSVDAEGVEIVRATLCYPRVDIQGKMIVSYMVMPRGTSVEEAVCKAMGAEVTANLYIEDNAAEVIDCPYCIMGEKS